VVRGAAVRRAAALPLLTVAAVALGGPAVALAQSGSSSPLTSVGATTSPFSPGLPQSTPSITTTSAATTTSTSSNSDSGLTGGGIAAIAVGAIVVIGGISFFIWYDSRRRAPVRRLSAAYGAVDGGRRAGSKAKPKARKPSPAERRRRKRGRAR
jgi:hypothetical protein